MPDDPRRCPECDFELWYVHARYMRHDALIGPADSKTSMPQPFVLNTTDAIVCSRCGWWRPAEATDLPITAGWARQV